MNRSKIIILLSIILLILIGIYCYLFIFNNRITFETVDSDITIALNDVYKETGAIAKICNISECKDISENVEITNNIDNTKIGNYEVTYILNYGKTIKKIVKKVSVVDVISPELFIEGSENVSICPNSTYIEDGFKAIDNYDGDISDQVESIVSDDKIEYIVKDSSSNEARITRYIIKEDVEKPVITLKGSKTITVDLGTTYNDPGATAFDVCDNELTNKIETTNNVNTNEVGVYTVTYRVKDNSNNTATATRNVKVTVPIILSRDQSREEYLQNLERYITEKKYNVSIGYVNLRTGYSYRYKENVVYYGASLVKTVDALYIYENNMLNDDTRAKVKKAISISDNNAHIQLVNYIGMENLRAYGRNLGASNFLTRGNNDYYGNTTVNDQIAIWKKLYNYITTAPNGGELKQYFINTFGNELLFDGIPVTMHKYGYSGAYYHDVGIIYSSSPYLVVILTKHGSSNFKTVIKDLSQKMYDFNYIDR